MLIESTRIRELLNTTVTEAAISHPDYGYSEEELDALRAPRSYGFSINPIPALVILLLGIMMSSHTQQEMISAMVHQQWGNLLAAASCARGLTYVILYLKPPKSILPSRPPTELLTAFGLIAGGTIFMASVSELLTQHSPDRLRSSFSSSSSFLTESLLTGAGHRAGNDRLRTGRDVHIHGDDGLRRPAHDLGRAPPGPEGLGRPQGVSGVAQGVEPETESLG